MNLTSPRRSTPNDDENPVPVELPHVLVIESPRVWWRL